MARVRARDLPAGGPGGRRGGHQQLTRAVAGHAQAGGRGPHRPDPAHPTAARTGRVSDKAILNLGTIVANGGTLVIDTGVSTLSNGIANFGTMIVSNATDTLVLRREAETGAVTNNNFIINTGTILINGGTLTANTAITNQFLAAAARPD